MIRRKSETGTVEYGISGPNAAIGRETNPGTGDGRAEVSGPIVRRATAGAGDIRPPWASIGGREALRRTVDLPPDSRAARVTTVSDAQRVIRSLESRCAEREERLRAATCELGRRATELQSLRARVAELETDLRRAREPAGGAGPDETALSRALAERDAEAARRADVEATLRAETDWRDYVIRDLEGLPDVLREREAELARLRSEVEDLRRQSSVGSGL